MRSRVAEPRRIAGKCLLELEAELQRVERVGEHELVVRDEADQVERVACTHVLPENLREGAIGLEVHLEEGELLASSRIAGEDEVSEGEQVTVNVFAHALVVWDVGGVKVELEVVHHNFLSEGVGEAGNLDEGDARLQVCGVFFPVLRVRLRCSL